MRNVCVCARMCNCCVYSNFCRTGARSKYAVGWDFLIFLVHVKRRQIQYWSKYLEYNWWLPLHLICCLFFFALCVSLHAIPLSLKLKNPITVFCFIFFQRVVHPFDARFYYALSKLQIEWKHTLPTFLCASYWSSSPKCASSQFSITVHCVLHVRDAILTWWTLAHTEIIKIIYEMLCTKFDFEFRLMKTEFRIEKKRRAHKRRESE